MLGLTVVIAQAALSGLLAYWMASRSGRATRAIGVLLVVVLGWVSVVALLNKIAGYQPDNPVDTNLAILLALSVGWLAGRNKRVRGGSKRLLFDPQVRGMGMGIIGISYVYGLAMSLLTLSMELAIVKDAAGFGASVVALFIAPLTFALAPLYAGLVQQNWLPAAFAYGGSLTIYLGVMFGKSVTQIPGPDVDKRDREPVAQEVDPDETDWSHGTGPQEL
jgi:hypothetical protein